MLCKVVADVRKCYGRGKKIKKYLFLVLCFATVAALYVTFESRVRPVINAVALSKAKNLAVSAISEIVNETMANTPVTYSDLVIFQKNNTGNITAVTSNVVEINKLKSHLTSEIEKRLNETEVMTSRIPLGTFLNQSILSGLGPQITVKMIPLGYTSIDIKNEFSAAGINQTRHEIYLEVSCSMSVLLPVTSQSANITTQVPLAETIIVGTVPETYTSISGQDDPNDAALNVLP